MRSGPPIAPRKPVHSEARVSESGVAESGGNGVKKTQLGVAPMEPIQPVDGATTIAMDSKDLAEARGAIASRDEVSGERQKPDIAPYTQRMPSPDEQSGEKPIPGTAPLAKPVPAPADHTLALAKPIESLKKVSEAPKPIPVSTSLMQPLRPSDAPKADARQPSPIPAPRTPMLGHAPTMPALPLVDSYATNNQKAAPAAQPSSPPQAMQQPSAPPPAMKVSPPPPMQAMQQPSAPPPAMKVSQPPPMQMPSAPPPMPSAPRVQMLSRPPTAIPSPRTGLGSSAPAVDPSEGDRPTFHVYTPQEIQSRQKLSTLTGTAEFPVVTPMHKMTGLKILGVFAAVALVIGTVAAGIAVASEDKPHAAPSATVAPPTTPPAATTVAPPAATVPPTPYVPNIPTTGKPHGKPNKPNGGGAGKPPSGPLPGNPYGK